MVNYELIVAADKDGIIGITDASGNQRLPFVCREDLRHFREMTTSRQGHQEFTDSERGSKFAILKSDSTGIANGNILVMGRKTFESLPRRPLPGRTHIV